MSVFEIIGIAALVAPVIAFFYTLAPKSLRLPMPRKRPSPPEHYMSDVEWLMHEYEDLVTPYNEFESEMLSRIMAEKDSTEYHNHTDNMVDAMFWGGARKDEIESYIESRRTGD